LCRTFTSKRIVAARGVCCGGVIRGTWLYAASSRSRRQAAEDPRRRRPVYVGKGADKRAIGSGAPSSRSLHVRDNLRRWAKAPPRPRLPNVAVSEHRRMQTKCATLCTPPVSAHRLHCKADQSHCEPRSKVNHIRIHIRHPS
jgi:hypothetical protein